MNLWEEIRTALGSVFQNKLRTALTMLGIVIGVAAVIALSGLGEGVTAMVTSEIEGIGSNIIMISPRQSSDSTRPAVLTNADAEALANPLSAPDVSAVAPQVTFPATVVQGSTTSNFTVIGTNQYLDDIMAMEPAMGGFLAAHDLTDYARVAVLGWEAYSTLFDDGVYPIQQNVTIDGVRYTIVGVAEKQGGMMGTDNNIWIPLTTAQNRHYTQKTLSGERTLTMILAQSRSPELSDEATRQITGILRREHKLGESDPNDFTVTAQEDILNLASSITGTLTLFLGAIAGISLLVGGIGIMNIMLVTVTERTREIGIRKAIGAPPSTIMVQFVIEALLLTLLGGVIGMLLGSWGASVLGNVIGVTAEITPQILLLATGVSAATGILFGTYPAARAAQLNPIEALRHE